MNARHWGALAMTAVVLAWAGPVSASLEKDSHAGECVVVAPRSNKVTQITNNCGVQVQVGYCSTDRPISGKRCGDRPNADNPFYTHRTTISPGRSTVLPHPLKALRLAPCVGSMQHFTSGQDGHFSCNRKRSEQLAWVHGKGATREEACQAARSAADPAELTKAPCECRVLGGRVHYCKQATTLPIDEVRVRRNFVRDIQNWMRGDKPPACDAPPCAAAIGVRG